MKNRLLQFFLVLVVSLSVGCKSTFEKVRVSNDPELILKEANKYYQNEEYGRAQSLYEIIIPFYRGKKEAEDLFYKYTYSQYYQEEYILAAHYFNNFTTSFYNSPRKEEMAFMAAYSDYQMSPNPKLDQTASSQAIDKLQQFINTYPQSERIEECNKLMDELRYKLETKSVAEGKLYFDLRNYQSAMTSLQNTLKDFPETKSAEEINYLIVRSSEQLAKNSVYEKMQNRLDETINLSNKFNRKYPRSEYKAEVQATIDFCKNELKRFINDWYQK